MRKIKSFVNKLKDKYYRSKEDIFNKSNKRLLPGNSLHDDEYKWCYWNGKCRVGDTKYLLFDTPEHSANGGSWHLNPTPITDTVDDIQYGRYEGLDKQNSDQYIRDESSNDVFKTSDTYKADAISTAVIDSKEFTDKAKKYGTEITLEQYRQLTSIASSYVTEANYVTDYFPISNHASTPTYTFKGVDVKFNEEDSEEIINKTKQWLYYIHYQPNTTTHEGSTYEYPRMCVFGWGHNLGNTTDTDVNAKFTDVITYLGLLPKFLPKNLYTFTSDRYNPTQSAGFYQYSTVLDDVLSSKNTGVLHKASNLNISKILYNPLMASGFGFGDIPGVPAFAEANNQLASQEGYMGGTSHDILKKFLLKNGNLEDSYYIINKNIVNEYPRAAEILAKLMSLSEEELAPIINDPFRKATDSSVLYTNVDEEEFKKCKAFIQNKVTKYHVLDLAMRKVPGYEISDLSYLTDEFLQAHQDCRAVFLRNSRYCYVPKDAETYALSNLEFNKLINPKLIDGDTTPIIKTAEANLLANFTKDHMERMLTSTDSELYGDWANQDSSTYRFSTVEDIVRDKAGQELDINFSVFKLADTDTTHLYLVVDKSRSSIYNIAEPSLYNDHEYEKFNNFYKGLGYTVTEPSPLSEEQITKFIPNLPTNAYDLSWNKVEQANNEGFETKVLFEKWNKRDILSPDNFKRFLNKYKTSVHPLDNTVTFVIPEDDLSYVNTGVYIKNTDSPEDTCILTKDYSIADISGVPKAEYEEVREWFMNHIHADSNMRVAESSELSDTRVSEINNVQDGAANVVRFLTEYDNKLNEINNAITLEISDEKLSNIIFDSTVEVKLIHKSAFMYGNTLSELQHIFYDETQKEHCAKIAGKPGWYMIVTSIGTTVHRHGESSDNSTTFKEYINA